MRFRTVRDRPHEDRPLHPGSRTGSILIAFHARPGTDVDAAMAEVEAVIRPVLDDWYRTRGHKVLEAAPDLA